MTSLGRVIVCLVLFGLGAEAFHGLGPSVAVILSAIIALTVNYCWRDYQRRRRGRERRRSAGS